MGDFDFIDVAGNLLLFMLVFNMSATVDIKCMREQLKNRNAILTGITLQFILLPLLGFAVVKSLNLSHAMGITLLVVTSSPGGSYSNWWCSLFNADLALSVTMTAISTLLSVVTLPANLLFYTRFTYDDDVVGSLDWVSLFTALIIVISAIGLGLLTSAKVNSHKFNIVANRLGNFSGLALVIFSATLSSTGGDSQLWDHGWKFYVGVMAPCVLGLALANVLTSCLQLKKPERVTVSVECCYQNVGIATSVALTMFEGDELSEAMGVPLFYGMVEAVILGMYCLVAWKMGWTKAPPKDPIWKVLATSYEVLDAEEKELEAVELEAVEVSCIYGKKPVEESISEFGETLFHYFRLDCGSGQKEHSGELPLKKDDTIRKDDELAETLEKKDNGASETIQESDESTKSVQSDSQSSISDSQSSTHSHQSNTVTDKESEDEAAV